MLLSLHDHRGFIKGVNKKKSVESYMYEMDFFLLTTLATLGWEGGELLTPPLAATSLLLSSRCHLRHLWQSMGGLK
jgi:hypothetical protein